MCSRPYRPLGLPIYVARAPRLHSRRYLAALPSISAIPFLVGPTDLYALSSLSAVALREGGSPITDHRFLTSFFLLFLLFSALQSLNGIRGAAETFKITNCDLEFLNLIRCLESQNHSSPSSRLTE